MVIKGRIVLSEEKMINGNLFKPGTVLANFECEAGFTAQDVDLSVQLQQSKVSFDQEEAPKKEAPSKNKAK